MEKKESAKDRNRRLFAEAWIIFSRFPGTKFECDPQFPRDLASLLGPIAALQLIGTSEKLTRQLIVVGNTAFINQQFPKIHDDDRKAIAYHLNILAEGISRSIEYSKAAEKTLMDKGWRFDPMTGRATLIRKGKGRDFLRECVWAIYTAKYRAEYQDAANAKKLLIRRKIAAVLAPYFDAELYPESGALIDDAIRKGEKRRR